jgi:hypothetical protein
MKLVMAVLHSKLVHFEAQKIFSLLKKSPSLEQLSPKCKHQLKNNYSNSDEEESFLTLTPGVAVDDEGGGGADWCLRW